MRFKELEVQNIELTKISLQSCDELAILKDAMKFKHDVIMKL